MAQTNVKPVAYDSGMAIHLLNVDRNALKDDIKPMIYELVHTDNGPVLKKDKEHFKTPTRILGTTIQSNADLVMKSFEAKRKPLGAMAIGQKGTGKTEGFQLLANRMVNAGYPVIMVRTPCTRGDIEMAVKMCMPKGCAVFFDEYGKTYKDHTEDSEKLKNELLTMFSDTSLGKVLWLLTDNTTRNFNDFLLERPTRIRYRFDFAGCSRDIVEDICKLNKLNKEITEWVIKHARTSKESIDGVLAICSEGKDAKTLEDFIALFRVLNVMKPKYSKVTVNSTSEDVKVEVDKGNIHIVADGDVKEFQIGKSPLSGRWPSFTFDTGKKNQVEIIVQEIADDPGEIYNVDVGVLHKRSGAFAPW